VWDTGQPRPRGRPRRGHVPVPSSRQSARAPHLPQAGGQGGQGGPRGAASPAQRPPGGDDQRRLLFSVDAAGLFQALARELLMVAISVLRGVRVHLGAVKAGRRARRASVAPKVPPRHIDTPSVDLGVAIACDGRRSTAVRLRELSGDATAGRAAVESGRRGSNPQPPRWNRDVLPPAPRPRSTRKHRTIWLSSLS
jgi:hypothetical protein